MAVTPPLTLPSSAIYLCVESNNSVEAVVSRARQTNACAFFNDDEGGMPRGRKQVPLLIFFPARRSPKKAKKIARRCMSKQSWRR